ncbi:hypothetical protein [Roseovarius sp. C03]|uniref:hypothetical protein n=1 Tax=Roseovarius sp. C03 TaxID=3449222 RepID=UPI003EDBE09B
MRLDTLRAANIERQTLWPGVAAVDLPFRGLELAGEIGELCNLVKKLHRHRGAIAGNRAADPLVEDKLLAEIFEELGDALVSLDLLAMDLGLDLGPAAVEKFNRVSERVGIPVYIGVDRARGPDETVFHELGKGERVSHD